MSLTLRRSIAWPGRNTLVALGLAVMLLGACRSAQAQAPIAGQPYQVPAGYQAYGAGTLISYGGYNYVSQGNGTMLLAQQQGVTTYTTPSYRTPGYGGYGGYGYGRGPGIYIGPGFGYGGYGLGYGGYGRGYGGSGLYGGRGYGGYGGGFGMGRRFR